MTNKKLLSTLEIIIYPQILLKVLLFYLVIKIIVVNNIKKLLNTFTFIESEALVLSLLSYCNFVYYPCLDNITKNNSQLV